jgi:hypothetical protein
MKGSNMARLMFAALAGAMLVASPVLANEPVRPSAAAVTLQPAGLQVGARLGSQMNGKKYSDMTQAATGAILAGLVAVGAGVGIATSNGGHSTSP